MSSLKKEKAAQATECAGKATRRTDNVTIQEGYKQLITAVESDNPHQVAAAISRVVDVLADEVPFDSGMLHWGLLALVNAAHFKALRELPDSEKRARDALDHLRKLMLQFSDLSAQTDTQTGLNTLDEQGKALTEAIEYRMGYVADSQYGENITVLLHDLMDTMAANVSPEKQDMITNGCRALMSAAYFDALNTAIKGHYV